MNGVCPAAFQTDFSAFRYFLKTNVAQSVAELVLYTQKTRNVVIFYQIW